MAIRPTLSPTTTPIPPTNTAIPPTVTPPPEPPTVTVPPPPPTPDEFDWDGHIQSGEPFLVALDVHIENEQDCLAPENDSPIGDFLVLSTYFVSYEPASETFHTRGLNHGKAGCPWETSTNAREGSDINRQIMRLWGVYFKYDERGRVYWLGEETPPRGEEVVGQYVWTSPDEKCIYGKKLAHI